MKSYYFLKKVFNMLRRHEPWKLVLIFMVTLTLGISSGFSIMLLIPLLQLLNITGGGQPDGIAIFIRSLATKSGIDLTIESVLLIYVILLTINALLMYWNSIVNSRYQQTFIYTLRRRLFRKIIFADWSRLNSKSKTNHVQVLTKEVPNMAAFLFCLMNIITTLIFTVSFTLWALAISVKFTLLIVAIGIALFVFLRKFLFRSLNLGEGSVTSYNQLLKYIDDFWQTVKIAKVHSSENFYYSKFDEANNSLLDIEFRLQRNWSLPQLIYRIAGIVILVIIIYAGYRLELIPLTSFFVLILLFSRIYPQITKINNDMGVLLSNVASVELVIRLDEEFPDEVLHVNSSGESLPLDTGISLENLKFSYPDGEYLFDGYSETIPAKKITGIVGESGRGKTTLIDLIAGLQKPDNGAIKVDGWLLNDKMLPRWKSSIGYLPQDPFFIDGTLRENLVWDSSTSISEEDIMEMLRKVNAVPLVERYSNGLDTPVMNYQFQFSGGERQRLALARVLLRHPRLLLLDEATSSLDPENEKQVMEVIASLKESVTIVFVTHRISLHPWFDKVIRI